MRFIADKRSRLDLESSSDEEFELKPNEKTTECPKESKEPESSQTITDSDNFVNIGKDL